MEQKRFYRDQTKRFCQILDRAVLNEDGREVILYQELFGTFEKKAAYADSFFSTMEPVTLLSGQSHMLEPAEEDAVTKTAISEKTSPEEMRTAATYPSDGPEQPGIPEDTAKKQETADKTRQSSDLLMAFLDASEGAEKLEILEEMKDCVTDYMVDAMAISLDMEISDGVLEDRYQQLIRGLKTKNKYEMTRRRM